MSFKDNVFLFFLPPITHKDDLRDIFSSILEDLIKDKNYVYELSYSFFLHTNDPNLKLTFYLSPVNGFNGDDLRSAENIQTASFYSSLYAVYKFMGYYKLSHAIIDFEKDGIFSYIESVLRFLDKTVWNINQSQNFFIQNALSGAVFKGLGFIDFKKNILVTVQRIPLSKF